MAKIVEIRAQIDVIAQGAITQARSIEQVNQTAHEMDKLTQHNAAMAEQTNAAAQSLAEEAQELTTLTGRFNIEGERRPSDRESSLTGHSIRLRAA